MTPLLRAIIDWASALALAFTAAWIICAGMGQSGFDPVPSLWAGGSIIIGFLSLIIGMALLGCAAWLINRGGEFYLGGLVASFILAIMLINRPGLETWLREMPQPTGAVYIKLAIESILWQASLLAVLIFGSQLPKPWHKQPPTTASDGRPFIDINEVRLNRWSQRTLMSAAVCFAAFIITTWVFMRSPGAVQSIMAAGAAGFLSAVIARITFPSRNPLVLFAVPLIVGPAVYLYAAISFGSQVSLMESWNQGHLPGIANALPAHLAVGSFAGLLLGCLLINKANEADAEAIVASVNKPR